MKMSITCDTSFSLQGIYIMVVMVQSLSCLQFLLKPGTVAHQAPPVHGISQARILELIAISFSSINYGNMLILSRCMLLLLLLSHVSRV